MSFAAACTAGLMQVACLNEKAESTADLQIPLLKFMA
jgi:hypothetical protein